MAKKQYYVVSLKVHPAVARWFDNNFTKVNGAYDILKSDIYFAIAGCLERSRVKIPARVSRKLENYKEIKITITSFDFYNYGWEISPLQQYRISKFILMKIVGDACYKIMLVHSLSDIPRDAIIKEILLENLFEEDELTFANLRKIYQRKYVHKEQLIKELLDNIGYYDRQKHSKKLTKKNHQIVPNL